jgi:hypothetical protein
METITKTFTLYSFNELSEDAKDKALRDYQQGNMYRDFWHEDIQEDAKMISAEIKEWDIYRGICKIEFLQGIEFTVYKILKNHGESCETYKLAKEYNKDFDLLVAKYSNGIKTDIVDEENEEEFDEEIKDLEMNFKHALEEEYLSKLTMEYEWFYSNGYAIEYFNDMDYKFLENGEYYDNF